MSVQRILEEVEHFISTFEFEKAIKKLELGLKKHPDQPEFLDVYADISIQIGEVEKAREFILKSIQLSPDTGSTKYMNMGQISVGMEAIEYYHKGVNVLKKELEDAGKASNMEHDEYFQFVKNHNSSIISGYCSIAELYMTDECFNDNAEQECERLLNEAINIDPNNYEALQLMCSFKISQTKKDDALIFLNRARESWGNADEPPPYELRVSAVKLYLELEQFEIAASVAEELIAENDSDSEAWYLYSFSLAPNEPLDAKYALDKCCELLTLTGVDDPDILNQVEELNTKITSNPNYQAPDIDMGNDDDDEDGLFDDN